MQADKHGVLMCVLLPAACTVRLHASEVLSVTLWDHPNIGCCSQEKTPHGVALCSTHIQTHT